jgi:hypothetical protein
MVTLIVTTLVAVAGAVTVRWSSPKHLHVVRYQQLTADRREKDIDRPLLSDAKYVYYREPRDSPINIVPPTGGETQVRFAREPGTPVGESSPCGAATFGMQRPVAQVPARTHRRGSLGDSARDLKEQSRCADQACACHETVPEPYPLDPFRDLFRAKADTPNC